MTESELEPATATKPASTPLRLPAPVRWVREVIALLVWGVAVTQLFIFDVESYVASHIPRLAPVLRFRFLILLGIIAVLWLVLGNRRFSVFVGYVIAYPFVVVFWILPRLLFRNWAIVIAFSPAVYSLLSTFRFNFAMFVAALISSFVIGLSSNPVLVAAAMAVLAIYLVAHFFRRFRVAFSPSTVFADVSGAIRRMWGGVKEWVVAKRPTGCDPESNEYKQAFVANILAMYVMTTGLYIVGERLRQVINSRKLDLYFLGTLLYTFFLTVISFALEYFGLERIVPGSFVGAPAPGFFHFLGLSFSVLMTSDISPLKAAGGFAQVGMYVQLFGSLLIIVLLVFVVLTSIRERYRQDLDGVVTELGIASDSIGRVLEQNFELTMAAVEARLIEVNPDLTRWFIRLRGGEPPREVT